MYAETCAHVALRYIAIVLQSTRPQREHEGKHRGPSVPRAQRDEKGGGKEGAETQAGRRPRSYPRTKSRAALQRASTYRKMRARNAHTPGQRLCVYPRAATHRSQRCTKRTHSDSNTCHAVRKMIAPPKLSAERQKLATSAISHATASTCIVILLPPLLLRRLLREFAVQGLSITVIGETVTHAG